MFVSVSDIGVTEESRNPVIWRCSVRNWPISRTKTAIEIKSDGIQCQSVRFLFISWIHLLCSKTLCILSIHASIRESKLHVTCHSMHWLRWLSSINDCRVTEDWGSYGSQASNPWSLYESRAVCCKKSRVHLKCIKIKKKLSSTIQSYFFINRDS